jgi:hypothetical protein
MRSARSFCGVLSWSRTATKQIQLLETFAAQAVIAIQNARLHNETKEALEQQDCHGRDLRVISSSPTDLQPVFESILTNALRFCSAHMGQLYLYDGEKFHNVANRGQPRLPQIRSRKRIIPACFRRHMGTRDCRAPPV